MKSSEIEGQQLNPQQVRSSLARRLGIDIGALTPADRNVEGIVQVILDATQNYDKPITANACSAGMQPYSRRAIAGF